MKRLAWVLMRVAGIGTAVAVLAGCGGAVSQTGPVPVSGPSADRAQPHAGRSRMAPGATSGDLLYVADAGYPRVYMLSYPQGKLVGTLTGIGAEGECVDKAGDVFITQGRSSTGEILEYAHGGTSPIATLSAPGQPAGCSVDPVTGNLAVVMYDPFSTSSVAIYPDAQGNPTIYSDPNVPRMLQCIYDNQGNLFVSGYLEGSGPPEEVLVELPAGSGSFTGITIKGTLPEWSGMQWDGQYIALDSYSNRGSYYVYRLRVSGTTGKVVGTTTLVLTRRKQFTPYSQFWIQGNRIIATGGTGGTSSSEGGQVYFWKYPAGGKKPTKTIRVGSSDVSFVAVSPG